MIAAIIFPSPVPCCLLHQRSTRSGTTFHRSCVCKYTSKVLLGLGKLVIRKDLVPLIRNGACSLRSVDQKAGKDLPGELVVDIGEVVQGREPRGLDNAGFEILEFQLFNLERLACVASQIYPLQAGLSIVTMSLTSYSLADGYFFGY